MRPDEFNSEESTPTVLVIDDSPDVHRLLKARLRTEDLRLTHANDGEEGLQFCQAQPPALILLDIEMPGIDGFEVLRSLKDDPKLHHVPVIILSALQSPQDKVMAFDLGAVDYITKPFDFTELRARVRSALHTHALLQLLSQRAQIDGLTGLWNRAHFDGRFCEALAAAQRRTTALSLAMLDIDHFKSINDTFGHPAGDAVLSGFAKAMKRATRQEDISCRYGGEEFAIIMPGTPPEEALHVCDRIRGVFESIEWPRHPDHNVTVSIGIAGAASPNGTLSASSWVERADQALYAAKNQGRNRVVVSDLNSLPMREAG